MHPDRFCKIPLQFKRLLKARICNLSPTQIATLENVYLMKKTILHLQISQIYSTQGTVYAWSTICFQNCVISFPFSHKITLHALHLSLPQSLPWLNLQSKTWTNSFRLSSSSIHQLSKKYPSTHFNWKFPSHSLNWSVFSEVHPVQIWINLIYQIWGKIYLFLGILLQFRQLHCFGKY